MKSPEDETLYDPASARGAGEAKGDEDEPQSTSPDERYDLLEGIGEGAMAEVFAARDRNLRRIVAVKLLRPRHVENAEMRQRFFDEALILADLQHPGVVPVYEAGRLGDRSFYAMKKVEGKTLGDVLRERGAAEVGERGSMLHLLHLFERVCQTVAAAHAKGIIHRDLKPENIMLDEPDAVLVMDWGLAKVLDEPTAEESDSSRTRHGIVMGTPAYMSPEQAGGLSHLTDTQSDVFSLGIILYEILTGKRPFSTEDARRTMKEILFVDPVPPRDVVRSIPRPLSAICLKALNKDPRQRYASARELAEDIRAFREMRPIVAYPPRWRDRIYLWALRRPARAASLVTLAAVGILAVALLGFQFSMESRARAFLEARLSSARAGIASLEPRVDALRAEIAVGIEDPQERAQKLALLEELEAELNLRTTVEFAMLSAIRGFTILSSDREAEQEAKRAVIELIRLQIEAGDYVLARTWARAALEAETDDRLLAFSKHELAEIRGLLAEADQATKAQVNQP